MNDPGKVRPPASLARTGAVGVRLGVPRRAVHVGQVSGPIDRIVQGGRMRMRMHGHALSLCPPRCGCWRRRGRGQQLLLRVADGR